ncbi:hypothetical protein CAXC1_70007 [Candidatus Xenohaliotis californiensis]|uniref:AsmA domain-containing protein n=1 Tax=Candidatus Xenohaliotis californiensis TaxID=84677 RepID=A0ABM9N912_9RICK|nr:hypothetical protein CAXC1_70007 [Candidatus Xenohaliotis californiensis]
MNKLKSINWSSLLKLLIANLFKLFAVFSVLLHRINNFRTEKNRKLINSIVKVIIVSSFAFTFIVLAAQTFFIDWNKYGEKIAKILSDKLNSTVVVQGGVSGSLVPGSIVLRDVYINHDSNDTSSSSTIIEEMQIKFGIYRALFGVVSADNLQISGAKFSLDQLSDITGGESMLSVNFTDCALIFGSRMMDKEINKISGKMTINKGKVDADMSFLINNIVYKMKVDSYATDKNSNEVTARVDAYHIGLSFDGNSILDDNGYHLKGALKAQGDNLTTALDMLSVGASGSVFGNYSMNEKYILNANIVANNNGIDFNNFKLTSNSINGVMDLKYNFSSSAQSELNMHVENIDLSAMQPIKGGEYKNSMISSMDFKIPKTINGLFTIHIDSIKYRDFNIKELVAEGDIAAGELSLYEMRCLMPGESVMHVSGSMHSNQVRPRFDGSVHVTGMDATAFLTLFPGYDALSSIYHMSGRFQLKTSLILAPYIASFVSLAFKAEANELNGSFRYKWGGDKQMVVANLDVGTLDVSILHNALANRDLSQSFSWLTNPKLRAKAEVHVKEFVVGASEVIHDSVFSLEMYSNTLVVKQLKLTSSNIDLRGDVRIIYNSTMPVVYAKLNSRYLHFSSDSNHIVRNVTDSGADFSWPRKTIDIDFLRDVRAQIEISVDKFSYANIVMENVLLNVNLSNNNINIEDSSAMFADGKFTINGYIGIYRKIMANLAFSLAEAKMEKLSEFINLKSVRDGYVSISGSFNGSGNSIADIMSNANGACNVAVRKFTVNGVDFNSFADNITAASTKSEMLSIAEQSAYSGKTLFKSSDLKMLIEKGLAKIEATSLTSRTASSISANVHLPTLLMHGIVRIFFIPPTSKQKVAADLELKGFVKYPVRSFNADQLEKLVFQGINPLDAN